MGNIYQSEENKLFQSDSLIRQISFSLSIFVACFGLIFFLNFLEDNILTTSLLYISVLFLGGNLTFLILRNSSYKFKITMLWCFYIKIFLGFLFLLNFWIPDLFPILGKSWGYDPQRFYFQSYELSQNEWIPEFLNLNYAGILYVYGFLFEIFGHNPFIPLLTNSLLTYFSLLLLASFIINISASSLNHFIIPLFLFIPEVIWFDIMTSRENLIASLIIIGSLSYLKFLNYEKGANFFPLFVFVLCLLCISLIRTTMIMPLLLYCLIISFFWNGRIKIKLTYLISSVLLVAFLIYFSSILQVSIGGYSLNFYQLLQTLVNFENNIASQFDWGDNSIGLMIAPNNFIEAIIFTPVRMIIYLAIPIPELISNFSFSGITNNSSYQFAMLISSFTSTILIILFPHVVSGTIFAFQNRINNPKYGQLAILMWLVFLAVGFGNIILHERYRLMFIILYFAVAWMGITFGEKNLTKGLFGIWAVLIFTGGALFLYLRL